MASGEPKYLTIADALRARIDAGEWAPGAQLPAQQAMASDYGVTLMTLRQALAELDRDGIVHAVKGRGTFVSPRPAVRLGLDHLWSFVQEMEHQGVEVATEVLAVRFDEATDRVRAALGLDADEPVAEIVRRRLIGDRPVVVQHSSLARSTWERIADIDLTTTSLYDALRGRAGHRVERATETLRAVAATVPDAELLDVEPSTACLESTRVSHAADGPFLHDRAVLVGTAAEVCAERTAGGLRLGYRATP